MIWHKIMCVTVCVWLCVNVKQHCKALWVVIEKHNISVDHFFHHLQYRDLGEIWVLKCKGCHGSTPTSCFCDTLPFSFSLLLSPLLPWLSTAELVQPHNNLQWLPLATDYISCFCSLPHLPDCCFMQNSPTGLLFSCLLTLSAYLLLVTYLPVDLSTACWPENPVCLPGWPAQFFVLACPSSDL